MMATARAASGRFALSASCKVTTEGQPDPVRRGFDSRLRNGHFWEARNLTYVAKATCYAKRIAIADNSHSQNPSIRSPRGRILLFPWFQAEIALLTSQSPTSI